MNRAAEPESASGKTTKHTQSNSESERIAQVVHEAIDRFAEKAAEAEQRVRTAASDARANVKAKQQTVKEHADQAENAVESYVEAHPWRSLGVAFGVGIVIASLLRR